MSRRASNYRFGSEFDAFLFAAIGEDTSGLTLSVASALARMDLDPWQEAAKLATLPVDTAIQRVAELFRALPDESLSDPNRGALATRLIALLPAERSSPVKPPSSSNTLGETLRSRRGASAILFVIMLVLLALQFAMA